MRLNARLNGAMQRMDCHSYSILGNGAHLLPLAIGSGFHVFVFALMAVEFFYIRWQQARHGADKVLHSTSVAATFLWVGAALALALFILRAMGGDSATQYLAGYAIEEALSIDNLFVFLLLFKVFRIDARTSPRCCSGESTGAIVMRGAFIAAGIGLLTRFEWVSYLFAVVLLIAAIKLVIPEDEKQEGRDPGMAEVDIESFTR